MLRLLVAVGGLVAILLASACGGTDRGSDTIPKNGTRTKPFVLQEKWRRREPNPRLIPAASQRECGTRLLGLEAGSPKVVE